MKRIFVPLTTFRLLGYMGALIMILLALLVITAGDALAQQTTPVSVDSSGGQGDGDSWSPSISSDGRYVAFHSNSTNLVADDTNGSYDVFVHDTVTGVTTRVSVDSTGNQANDHSSTNSISSDGRYVAFESFASNLVAGDTNGAHDVFVHDTVTGVTTRVSVDSSGGQGNGDSYVSSISPDGRYVAFQSWASNLVPGDTNGSYDVFVHDTVTGVTTRVSVDSTGNQANDHSSRPSISSDGRYVAFESLASNLVAGDTNDAWDVFVHDTVTGVTTRVSVDSSGGQGNGGSYSPYSRSISSDGLYVAFESLASNLVAGDTNDAWDVFVHDTVTGVTTRMSVDSSGNQGNRNSNSPSISSDGRYVAFHSNASNLVAGDTTFYRDVFVHDTVTGVTTRVSVDSWGSQGNDHSINPSISSDGLYVAFQSDASNLLTGDTNDAWDVFVHDTVTGETSRVSVSTLRVTLLVPNGGEIIPSGSTYTIQWGAPPEAVSFKLKYSMDNGTTWKPIDSGITDTSYDWLVPTAKKNKKKYLVKVIGYDDSDTKVGADKSDAPFTIEVVKLTSPNGGETLTPGDMPTITWTTNQTKRDVAKVILKYTKNGGKRWKKIDTLIENTGTYEWTVPGVPKTKSNCKVKVVLKDAKGNTLGRDTSDGYFTIQP